MVNLSFQSFGKKALVVNLQWLKRLTYSFGESGTLLGKILVNDICFAKFAKVPSPEFCTIQHMMFALQFQELTQMHSTYMSCMYTSNEA